MPHREPFRILLAEIGLAVMLTVAPSGLGAETLRPESAAEGCPEGEIANLPYVSDVRSGVNRLARAAEVRGIAPPRACREPMGSPSASDPGRSLPRDAGGSG